MSGFSIDRTGFFVCSGLCSNLTSCLIDCHELLDGYPQRPPLLLTALADLSKMPGCDLPLTSPGLGVHQACSCSELVLHSFWQTRHLSKGVALMLGSCFSSIQSCSGSVSLLTLHLPGLGAAAGNTDPHLQKISCRFFFYFVISPISTKFCLCLTLYKFPLFVTLHMGVTVAVSHTAESCRIQGEL